MAEHLILKAVEYDKLPAKFRKEYPSLAALRDAGWWLQKKYDGCFGFVNTSIGEMFSRTGEPVSSCEHIIEAVTAAFGPGHVVLGEVWTPGVDFPTISGDFRRRRASPQLRFVVNDSLLLDEFDRGYSNAAYDGRWARVTRSIPERDGEALVSHAFTYYQNEWADAAVYAETFVANGGFDGAILRDPIGTWARGLVKQGEIIKVKPTLSLDLRVVGYQLKPGAKTGRPVVTLDVEYRGVVTTVGSGVPHDLTGVDTVGKIIEVESLGLTADGKLREPRFKGVRFDKHEPDA